MGASVIKVYVRVVMPANRLRVNHYDFMAQTVTILFYLFYFMALHSFSKDPPFYMRKHPVFQLFNLRVMLLQQDSYKMFLSFF